MSSVGHLVSKFQNPREICSEDDSPKADSDGDSARNMTDKGAVPGTGSWSEDGPRNGVDNTIVAEPSGKTMKKPTPSKKPTKPPPSVTLRNQDSGESKPPILRQNSTSFTTEDLDLFQRPRHGDEQSDEASSDKPETEPRKSRKDSVSRGRSDSQSDKRRSKSVGAFAPGALRPHPIPDKPKLPSKPKIAIKPLVGRNISIEKATSSPSKKGPWKGSSADDKTKVVLRKPKTDPVTANVHRSSRPPSSVNIRGPTTTKSTRPASGLRPGSRQSSLDDKNPKPAPKVTSTQRKASVDKTTESKAAQVKLRKSAAGSRPQSSHTDATASSRSKSRPISGVNSKPKPGASSKPSSGASSRPTSRVAGKSAGLTKSGSLESPTKENQTSPKRHSVKGSPTKSPQKKSVDKQASPKKCINSHSNKSEERTRVHKESPKQNASYITSKIAAKPSISPKPCTHKGSPIVGLSPRNSPPQSPRNSPQISPSASPKHLRKFSPGGVAASVHIESKAAARKTLISALSIITKRTSSTVPSCNQEGNSQQGIVVEHSKLESQDSPQSDVIPDKDGRTELNEPLTELGPNKSVHGESSESEPKAEFPGEVSDFSRTYTIGKAESHANHATEIIDNTNEPTQKRHHHDIDKSDLEKYKEGSLNKAVAKAAVGKILGSPPSKQHIVKPKEPPPPPPPNSNKASTGVDVQNLCEQIEAPISESESPVLGKKLPRHLKTGLNDRGHDLPVAKLIKELKAVGIEKSEPIKDAVNVRRSPLPLRVFIADGSPSSSDSERKPDSNAQSDSNDADDEDDRTVAVKTRGKNQLLIKSFSTGQEDVESKLVPFQENRPVSSISSTDSCETSSLTSNSSKTKPKKASVLEKLRKLSVGIISSENAGAENGDDSGNKVGNAVFYKESEATEGIESKRKTFHIGKTKFYSGKSRLQDNGSSNDELKPAVENKNINSSQEEKPPELPERLSRTLTPSSSFDRPKSAILVENENYESTNQDYENVMFGPIYEGIEIHKNKAGRNDLCNSPQTSVDQPNEDGLTMENNDGTGKTPSFSPPEENGNIMHSRAKEEPIYDVIDDLKLELDNAKKQIYENVEFGDPYAKRTIWRRKTIRRKTKKRRARDEAWKEGNANKDGDEKEPGGEFENFSDSEDSFTSDSFTDESDIEEQQGITLYAPLENPKPAEAEGDMPPMTKLQRIANELLTTERAYVQRLHLIDQIFHFRIVIENRSNHMFPEEVLPQMFSNIKSVYQFHHDFLLPQLEKRMAEWHTTPRIGDLMKKFAPFLKLYSEYVKNFDHAMNTISTWLERSPQFASLLAELHKKKECRNLSLQHHMLEPIQRVPRYEMLLKDYLKHLPENSDDKEDTKKALELVTTAASHSNEAMRKIEKFRKLLELNEKFGGTVDLIDPTRELVKEGKITKISARNGLQYERYLFFFNDMLLLCQTHTMGLIHSYRIKNVLEVDGMQVLEGDNLETPYTFYIKSKTKTIEVHTSSSAEKMEWFVTIENVIADFTRKQMSRLAGRKALEAFQEEQLGFRAPTWVKDQNTSMCMECGSPFSMIKRRHHCRCCGIVVCAKCSSQKAPLPYLGGKSDRVCSKCHNKLAGRSDQFVVNPNQQVLRKKGVLQVKGSDPSVISGMLAMSCDKKSWDKRWFALHDNYVLYSFKAPQDVHAITSLPLPGYEVESAGKDDHLDRDNAIKLFHHNQKKNYYFSTENNNIDKWLTSLRYATRAELPPDYTPTSNEEPQ